MTGDYGIERVVQSEQDSCQNACVAMLTDYTEQELIQEYGTPLDTSATREVLEDEYDHVAYKGIDIKGLRALCEVVENLLVVIESPLKERDPELHDELFEQEVQWRMGLYEDRGLNLTEEEARQRAESATTIKHAIVVHKGRIYDPRDPPYFRTLGSLGHIGYEDDYGVCDVWVCSDREPVFSWDDGGWPVASGWSE